MSSPSPSPPPLPPSSNDTPATYNPGSWQEFFDIKTFSFPTSKSGPLSTRLHENIPYFAVNYITLALMILPVLIILVNHPSSSTTPLAISYLCFYCYYFSTRYAVSSDRVFLGYFFSNTIFCVFIFNGSGLDHILKFFLVYMVVVCLHAALKAPRPVEGNEENPCQWLLDHQGAGGATYNTMQ